MSSCSFCSYEKRFQLFFLSCMALGAQLFEHHPHVWTTQGVCSQGCPGAHRVASRRECGMQWWQGHRRKPFLDREARARVGERLQWWSHLCVSLNNGASLLQWSAFPPQAFSAAFSSLPPLRLSPHSQEQCSPQACSPSPSSAPSPHVHWQHLSGWGHARL